MFQNRQKLIAGIAAVGIGLALVGFFVFVYPLLTTENEASRDVIAQQICPSVDANGTGSAECFSIVSEESEIRFILNEELGGQPTTVVGVTNDLAGEIVIDSETPSNSMIGPIEINLRTLSTDNDFRNRAIRAEILRSGEDAYEFTTFVPTSILGLPETITIGEPFTFTITGDLKLVDVTNSVTFEVTVMPVSEDRIEGTGTAQVLRSDFGLEIPRVPNVANVTDEVALEIDFVAESAA